MDAEVLTCMRYTLLFKSLIHYPLIPYTGICFDQLHTESLRNKLLIKIFRYFFFNFHLSLGRVKEFDASSIAAHFNCECNPQLCKNDLTTNHSKKIGERLSTVVLSRILKEINQHIS